LFDRFSIGQPARTGPPGGPSAPPSRVLSHRAGMCQGWWVPGSCRLRRRRGSWSDLV